MAAKNRKKTSGLSGVAFFCATLAVCVSALPAPSFAQQASGDSKLYLSSDTLVYDQDNNRIIVNGGVQIHYDGYKLVADKVIYDQASGRMVARGNVEMIEPGGNRIYADTLDITDDFTNGFVNALRVETPDDTHIAAESGQRINSTVMVLNNGVYTACKPCADHPEKAPFWQVKARKITQDDKTHTLRLEDTRFELLGVPLAYLPYLEFPDHTVRRKSGFLTPTSIYTKTLGYGVTVPYYMVLSPSSDVTFSPTYYSVGGLLLNGEFRKRFRNGTVTLRLGAIQQRDPSIFGSGTSDAKETFRGLAHTTGQFKINPRWTFGWDVLAQTDNNFAKTYQFAGLTGTKTNQIFLKGLGKRNSFDLHAYHFDVQNADPTSAAERRQALVPGVLDYEYHSPTPVAGGELSATINSTNIYRGKYDATAVTGSDRFHGLPGSSSRLTAELEWKRTLNTSSGLLLTPMVAARGDLNWQNVTNPNALSGSLSYGGNFYNGNTATRTMVTAGLEARYPLMMTAPGSTHILEPIAQIFVRPDEQLAGGLVNEDAQSFVFDATTLFERDKFSGFDRIEGGTRANVGFRYTGTFNNGLKLHGIFGQSYHLAGLNSFATSDLVNVGANSGLETKVSDFVGLVGVSTPGGFSLSSNGRFGKSNFDLKRIDTNLAYAGNTFSGALTYSQIAAQPSYGSSNANKELRTNASINLAENWNLHGGLTWDIDAMSLRGHSIGLTYNDECTIFSLNFARDDDSSATNWAVTARLSFRTIGYLQTKTELGSQ